LRDYIDDSSFQSKARRTRKRVYDWSKPAEGEYTAPINSPKWTRAGYTGSLKKIIKKYTNRSLPSLPSSPFKLIVPSNISREKDEDKDEYEEYREDDKEEDEGDLYK
jgi:hypothetical protein